MQLPTWHMKALPSLDAIAEGGPTTGTLASGYILTPFLGAFFIIIFKCLSSATPYKSKHQAESATPKLGSLEDPPKYTYTETLLQLVLARAFSLQPCSGAGLLAMVERCRKASQQAHRFCSRRRGIWLKSTRQDSRRSQPLLTPQRV